MRILIEQIKKQKEGWPNYITSSYNHHVCSSCGLHFFLSPALSLFQQIELLNPSANNFNSSSRAPSSSNETNCAHTALCPPIQLQLLGGAPPSFIVVVFPQKMMKCDNHCVNLGFAIHATATCLAGKFKDLMQVPLTSTRWYNTERFFGPFLLELIVLFLS